MYADERFENMKKNVNPIFMIIGMGIRIGLLLLLLCCGKFACDWAVNKSHNSVSTYEIEKYNRSKLRVIRDLKSTGYIDSKELKKRVQEVYRNSKQKYIKEYRTDEK